MAIHLALVTLVVDEYDAALAFYVGVLGFECVEDAPQPEPGKRWVVVRPPGAGSYSGSGSGSGTGNGGCGLLLARATTPAQREAIGRQTGGRVALFLHTDDLARDHATWSRRGVEFVRPPQSMPYGRVAVFRDPYGNLWDLVQPADLQPGH